MRTKRLLTALAVVLSGAILAACSSSQPPPSPPAPSVEASASSTRPDAGSQSVNALVVYFSMPETTSPDGMTREEDNSTVVIDGEVLGNTQYVAQLIQEGTGADIFRIEPRTPYPVDHDTLVDLASDEQSDQARPEIAATVSNLDQYDVIFLGYPTWWADMPMIMYTFLESVDLSGKRIIPFNTHGGSSFSGTIDTIADLQPDATVDRDGLTISRNDAEDASNVVTDWLNQLDLQMLPAPATS